MAQLAVALATTAILGPAGFALTSAGTAFAIGSFVGGQLFAPKPQGPKPADTKWAGVEYGTSIPYYDGTMRLPAIPVYLSDKDAVAQKTSGKGGGSVTSGYEYFCDALFLIADCESGGLLDAYRDGELIATFRAGDSSAGQETDAWSDIRFYTGEVDQDPDPDYEAAYGVGNAPAYVGQTSVFIKRLRLNGPNLPQLQFVVARAATEVPGDVALLINPPGTLGADLAPEDQTGWQLIGDADNNPGSPNFGKSSINATGLNVFGLGAQIYNLGTPGTGDEDPKPTPTWTPDVDLTLEGQFIIETTDPEFQIAFIEACGFGLRLVDDVAPDLKRLNLAWAQYSGGTPTSISTDTVTSPEYPVAVETWFTVAIGYTASSRTVTAYIDGVPILSETGIALAAFTNSQIEFRVCDASQANVLRVGSARMTIGRNRFEAGGYQTPQYPTAMTDDSVITYTPVAQELDDVVTRLHARCGQGPEKINVAALAGTPVRGLIAGQITPIRTVLEMLAAGFFFQRVESGGVAKYVDRGGASVVTIPYEDMGVGVDDAAEDALIIERANDLERPAQVALDYINVNDSYQVGTEFSDRLVTEANGLQKLQVGIAFTPAEAKGRADTIVLDGDVSRTTFTVALGMKYAYLEPTDVVTLTARDGSTFRARLEEVSDAAGVLSCKFVLDDAFVLSTSGITSDYYEPPTTIAAPGTTEMILMDIAPLRDTEAQVPGFMVATAQTSGKQAGASVRKSIDGADFATEVASITEQAVLGTATSELRADPPLWRIDRHGTLSVRVLGELASSTDEAMQADREINVLAVECTDGNWEVIRFGTATLTGTDGDYNLYTLSNLRRGLRGTEQLVGLHQVGDRVVLLTPSGGSRSVEIETVEIGLERFYRGVTLGRSISTATTQTLACESIRNKPFALTRPRATRDGSNNAVLFVDNRSRLLVRYGGAGGGTYPLGEASEAFEIDIYEDGTYTTVVRTLTGNDFDAGVPYSAANQTADGLTPGDPIYFKAAQVSALVGRGYELEAVA